ncbi:hypothetical protein B0I37DRAFT_402155 [Chaetomium sp. MPI-CAGE-AT-0009]|nr:hypothetical protein B0I37DRAFT_402155 [Chaetomium sp. MPI-CAGE-AT-0009]
MGASLSLDFWFGTVDAAHLGVQSGTVDDPHTHPNVLDLDILPNALDRAVGWVAGFLPSPIRRAPARWLPEWFLPQHIILKRQKKNWDGEFDNEKARGPPSATARPGAPRPSRPEHERLSCPMSGASPCMRTLPAIYLGVKELEAMLSEAFRPLVELRVAHDDCKIDNYRLVGDRIMVIDFDSSYVMDGADSDPDFIQSSVKWVLGQYNSAHRPGTPCSWYIPPKRTD